MYFMVQDMERDNSPKFEVPTYTDALLRYEQSTGIELNDGDDVIVYQLKTDEGGSPLSRHLDEM